MSAPLDAVGYNALVLEHFAAPRNVGRFEPGPTVVEGEAGDREQGVEFRLSAEVDESIQAMRFEAYGCPHCIAAASLLTERLRGATLGRVEQWSWRELASELALPTVKRGRLLILEDAVRALAADWRRKF